MSTAPIRVLFVIPDLRFGGVERHVATLLPNMDKNKFVPSAICIGDEGDLFADLVKAGIDVSALHMAGRRNASRVLVNLVAHMRRTRPDVVIVWGYNAEILGRIAALIAGVKNIVVWVHNVAEAELPNFLRDLPRLMLVPFTKRYFGVAEAQRTYITGRLRCPVAKVRIIHNGVDPAAFCIEDDRSILAEFGIDPEESVVGIVAALRPEKDHATLLRATRILVNELPKVKILVVGDGPSRAGLEELCQELEIADHVRFVGSRSDINRILRAVDVFVLSSSTECFPLSVLEAMACGRAVVCSDVGGVGEIVEDGVTGYLVPAGVPQQFSDRLQDVLSDPDLAYRMGQAGRKRVEFEFTLQRSVSAAEHAIKELCVS